VTTARELRGPAGTARPVRLPEDAAEATGTLGAWLIQAPGQAAAWEHYMVSVVHLRPIPGTPPPRKSYPEAAYELLLVALDPSREPNEHDPASRVLLRPINAHVQFHGVDDAEAVHILELAAKAVCDGVLPAEPADRRQKQFWTTMVKRTAHHHASRLHPHPH
jgi:hypothetical protein